MKAYLVGAGPGDPGLLTLRGKELLEQADVVIYDYLSAPELLAHTKAGAELVYVGKKAGAHTLPQDQINTLIVERAKAGQCVVRLKGGDPYIFGRGGEEAEALLDAGIGFEEVPGISSVVAGPAYAGIPLTYRQYASSVTIITGHEDEHKQESVHNWPALAASGSTLVFVMGMKNLPDISRELIKAGLSPDTPAALVHWATTSRQRSLAASLASLPRQAVEHGFTNPSLIVVGEVVRLRERLNWFEARPLFGKHVVVTRAREQASGVARQLAALGAKVSTFPTIRIEPELSPELDQAIHNLGSYQWLVFTSANGVRHFFARAKALGRDARALAGVQLAAIGSATAQALEEHGLVADFVPQEFVAEAVAQGLVAKGLAGARILLARAAEAREVLPENLREAGALVDVVPVYRTHPAKEGAEALRQAVEANQVDCVSFGSSSTVHNFFAQIPAATVRAADKLRFAAIGPITAATLQEYGFSSHIQPTEYTIDALVAAIEGHYAGDKQ